MRQSKIQVFFEIPNQPSAKKGGRLPDLEIRPE